MSSPHVLVCVSLGSNRSSVEPLRNLLSPPGAQRGTVSEPMAAAVGAGLPVREARGSMVLSIGSGTSEVAVVSLNGIVCAASVRMGKDKIDDAIIQYVRRNYGLLIGDSTAERIKIQIGTACSNPECVRHLSEGRTISRNSGIVLNGWGVRCCATSTSSSWN